MDPPWTERGGGRVKRGAQRHYKVMGKTRIRDAVLGSSLWLPAKHAHLYCWVTNNHLEHGLWLLKQLGFRYVTNLDWPKDRFGLGQYFRGAHELCLFAVRGRGMHRSVMTKRRNLPTSPLGTIPHVRDEEGKLLHSGKPAYYRRLMELRTRGPRVEFFARERHRGWDAWGDQLPEVA
jgi:N6-adenosine-specific RNA methylase IME4